MADEDVHLLCNHELSKLVHKLQSDLKQDFARIYNESIFCDVELVIGESKIYANCCVLQVRASDFFTELCSIGQTESGCCKLDIVSAETVKNFVRDLYLKDKNTRAESAVVKCIQQAKESPGIEEFLTPVTSPSELPCEDGGSQLLSPNSSYYSIVPVDWERELAEQDFLSASFQSILKKERTGKKEKVLKRPLSKVKSSKNHLYSKSLLDLKRAVKEDIILLSEDCNKLSSEVLFNVVSNPSINCAQVVFQCIFWCNAHGNLKEENESICNGYFDAEDADPISHDDVLSKENFLSQTSDFVMDPIVKSDLTEGSIQEQFQEESKSPVSTSSTDCNPLDTVVPRTCSLESWVKNAPSHNAVVQADFVDLVLEELVEKSQKRPADDPEDKVHQPDGISGTSLTVKPNFFINAASLLDETEIQSSSATADETDLKGENHQNSPSFQALTSSSDVHDISSHGNQDHQCSYVPDEQVASGAEEAFTTFITKARDESDCSQSSIKSDSDTSKYTSSEPPSTRKKTGEQGSYEKPSSLIRSNTFELETEDDRLAVLRQEYERRQGNMIFQRCVSQSSEPLSDGSLEHDQYQHCTSLTFNDVPLTDSNFMSSLPAHVVEEDVHTPDSLNNDFPETSFQNPSRVNGMKTDTENSIVDDLVVPELKSLDLNEKPTQVFNADEKGNFDSLPVVSGGATIICKETASPLFSRRKTESAPILSGAAPPCPDQEYFENKPKPLPKISMSSAWVVDISDITMSPEPSRRKKNGAPTGSSINAQTNELEAHTRGDSRNSSSGLGFFINLNNPKSVNSDCKSPSTFCSKKDQTVRLLSVSGSSAENNSKEDMKSTKNNFIDQRRHSVDTSRVIHSPEKKLFSMFIDIGDQVPPKSKPELSSRLKPMSHKHLIHGDSILLNQAKFNRIDKHVLAHANSKTISGENVKHEHRQVQGLKYFHQRTQSLSSAKGAASGEAGISPLSKTLRQLSTQSLHDEDNANIEEKSPLKPMFSSFHASLPIQEATETNSNNLHPPAINKAFNHGSDESLCSVDTYSIHTPENSMAADDLPCKGKDNNACKKRQFENKSIAVKSGEEPKKSVKVLRETRTNHNFSQEKVETKAESEVAFVRLSDLDREPVKAPKDVIGAATIQRMSRSIPETSWIESKLLMTQSTGGRSSITSSSRSLSRLFPHLSASGGSLGRSKTSSSCSPATEDVDVMRSSQVSGLSSMQSSVGLDYSTESTDISSGRGSPTTQLGDDLLKMFLEEINTDVTVEVGGRRIKAHKCILSSRCQYFAAILSGGWVESAGNVISLQGFSYNCVHFALCHIYSGASNIPDHISIVELATLADMLCLEGLKEVIMYTLKVKYCHFFHKPCAVCSVGVLECLPLATAYGLDDIYRKSLRWITKYFVKIWPSKAFVSLPRELIEKCYQQHIVHMSEENVLETIMFCDKLSATIPNVKWTETVFSLTARLMEACIKYLAENFSAVLASESFVSLGRDLPWNLNRLQESLFAACDRLPPGQACGSYAQLCSVLNVAQTQNPPLEMSWHPSFVELLILLRNRTERSLIRQAARAARTPAWGQLPLELRRKIQDVTCLVLNPADHTTSKYRRSTSDGGALPSHRSSVHSRNLDLRQLTMAMSQHARRAELSTAPSRKLNQPDRLSAPAGPLSKTGAGAGGVPTQGRPKTWPSQVKSRYLEKRPIPTKPAVAIDASATRGKPSSALAPVSQRRTAGPINKGLILSSSDSSRNSSPAMKRSVAVTATATTSTQPKMGEVIRGSSTAGSRLDNAPQSSDLRDVKPSEPLSKSPVRGKTQMKGSTNLPKTPPLRKKAKAVIPVDFMGDGENALTAATGNENITMSNDSLATHSSCDDCSTPHEEIKQQLKVQPVAKHEIAKSASAIYLSSEKRTEQRTPLTLANKKASPLISQKRIPLPAPKNTLSSPLPRRSTSMNTKAVNPPAQSSRLSIPLRTSASTSSVPEKNNSKINNVVDNFVKRSSVKDQSRPQSFTNMKRAVVGSGKSSSLSLAGRVSKSNKVNNNLSRSASRTNPESSPDSKPGNTEHPTVGPRSGTFLKDEPTVLNTPIVESQQA